MIWSATKKGWYESPGGSTSWGGRGSRVSLNKPKKTGKALFQALQGGPLRRYILNEVMATVNNKSYSHGYCDSTLGWHYQNDRIAKREVGRHIVYYITEKGLDYAKKRNLFS